MAVFGVACKLPCAVINLNFHDNLQCRLLMKIPLSMQCRAGWLSAVSSGSRATAAPSSLERLAALSIWGPERCVWKAEQVPLSVSWNWWSAALFWRCWVPGYDGALSQFLDFSSVEGHNSSFIRILNVDIYVVGWGAVRCVERLEKRA